MEKNKGVIGITCSTFDLLHTGHVIMLEECKKHCDYLICALQNDPTVDRENKNKPVQSIVERYLQLDAIRYVDKIIPYNTEKELEEIFRSLDIDVRIIGTDYKNKDFTAKSICDEREIKIIYNRRDHNYSSTNLREKIYKIEDDKLSQNKI
jgi:glycerol-3-phosphate cytidylyltransferase